MVMWEGYTASCWFDSSSVQGFGGVRFLVQSALAALHHVDEVGQSLLLVHRDVPEVTADGLGELGLVQTWPRLKFVVSLVTSQRVHLQLEQIHLGDLHVMVGRLSSIVTCLSLSLVANTLDEVLVEVANVKMTNAFVDVQLEFLLGYALLDPLAEGGVSSRSAASLSVLDQAAALAVERRCGWTVVTVLLRAEPVHPALASPVSRVTVPRMIRQTNKADAHGCKHARSRGGGWR